ncbi:MAG: zinc-binding alcohol dehydrogenase [Clostridia bacterium]|nr:zinc-binding alcohol dehydrogenase [Clostridia bacterium]
MNSNNIVFTKPNTAELVAEPVRAPAADEVVVKLAVSTISSGTERANLVGDPVVSIYSTGEEPAVFPRRCGYSSSGTVVQVGEGVTSLAVGDRVALAGSTHSQYVTIAAKNVYPIGELSFEEAALFYIGTFPLAAIRKCRLELGESALVMGLGVLGLWAVPLLKAAGAVPVIAADPLPEKREKALACGADYALDPLAADFADTVKQLTGGGANVGIEVTGVGAGLNGILDCMAPFGRVALLGCTRHSDFSVDYYRKVHGPGITLVGAHTQARPKQESSAGWWTQSDDMQTLKRLCEQRRFSPSVLVDETHSPREAAAVYTRLATEKAFPVVQFDWRDLL